MIPNNEQQKPMVENISCILPANDQLGGLFLGNVYGAQNSEILKEYGIRAVITASAQTKISYKFQDVPFHLKIEAHDKDDYYISEHINECIHFIEQHRKFTNVFVHCYAGVSRSSAIVCAYMMWKYRWNLQKTFNFVVFKRIVAKPNPGFYNQLKQVEIKLKIGTQNKPTIVRNSQETIVKQQTPSFYQQPEHIQPRNQGSMYQKAQLPVMANHNGVSNLHNRVSCQFKNSPPNQIYKTYNREELKQEPVSNTSRIVQGRQSVYEKNSSTVQNLNHSGVPIPKILNRRSEKVVKGDEIQKRNSFNYYLSPQLQPASPRNQLPLKSNSKMTTTGNSFYGSSLRNGSNVSNSEVFVQSSIYSTNYKTKGGYQNHQKAKSTSRCLIRPKDLPGYKNY